MSLAQICIMGPAASGVSLTSDTFTSNLINTGPTNGSYSAGMTLNTDGTTVGNNASNASNWHSPTTAGIGAKFWAQLTKSGSTVIAVSGTMTLGAWMPLSSAQTFTFTNNNSSSEGIGSYTVTFATDSAGANVTGTISGSIDVGVVL